MFLRNSFPPKDSTFLPFIDAEGKTETDKNDMEQNENKKYVENKKNEENSNNSERIISPPSNILNQVIGEKKKG